MRDDEARMIVLAAARRIDWGSVPAWFTLLAVGIAAATYGAARRDTARGPAGHVHAIVTSFRQSTDADDRHTEVVIVNGSHMPIFDVEVMLFGPGKRWRLWRVRRRRNFMSGDLIASRTIHTMTAASESEELPFPGLEVTLMEMSFARPPVVVRFGDGNGRRWIRWSDGRLSRVRRRR